MVVTNTSNENDYTKPTQKFTSVSKCLLACVIYQAINNTIFNNFIMLYIPKFGLENEKTKIKQRFKCSRGSRPLDDHYGL